MELNKCKRCGAFFVSNNCICPNCEPKDNAEIAKLKDFLSENDCPNSLDSLSSCTGISVKNLNRFLNNENFNSISFNLVDRNGNISINL